jgi:hypothetical protein
LFKWIADRRAVAWGAPEDVRQYNPARTDLCDCGHRRLRHDSNGVCAATACLRRLYGCKAFNLMRGPMRPNPPYASYDAIHAYICAMDNLPLLTMWRVRSGQEPVTLNTVKDDLKDKGFDQYRFFEAPPGGQGVEYTPVRDSRGKGTVGRHIHDRFEDPVARAESKSYYYGQSGDWFPLIYMDAATAINVWIEFLVERADFKHKKKIMPIAFIRPASSTMNAQIIEVMRSKPESWGEVRDSAGRGPPIWFVNRPPPGGGRGRHRYGSYGAVTLEWLKEHMPFLDWAVVPPAPQKEESEEKGRYGLEENPSVEQRVAQMKIALRAWKVPGEVLDQIDLRSVADPGISAGEQMQVLADAYPSLREYARDTKKGAREVLREARHYEEEMTEGDASRVMDELAARMEARFPGRGEAVREAIEYGRPQIVAAVGRRRGVRNPTHITIAAPHAAKPLNGKGHPSDTIVAELAVHTANALRKHGVSTRAILAGTPRTKRDMNRKAGRGSNFRREVERDVRGGG